MKNAPNKYKLANWGGSHTETYYIPREISKTRPDEVFQKIAVDILFAEKPQGQVRPDFMSLADVEAKYGKVFGASTKVYCLSKGLPNDTRALKYQSHINMLRRAIKNFIPSSGWVTVTYVTEGKGVSRKDLVGASLLQYSPLARYDGCNRRTGVAIWSEDHRDPVLEMEWRPHREQRIRRRKRTNIIDVPIRAEVQNPVESNHVTVLTSTHLVGDTGLQTTPPITSSFLTSSTSTPAPLIRV